MNLLAFLDCLDNLPAAPAARRDALARLGAAGWRGLAAAAPLALAVGTVAAAPTLTTPDAVALLLQLEQLQNAFYTQALGAAGPLPAAVRPDVERLQTQQQQHLAFLSQTLTDGGLPVPVAPVFDFGGQHGGAANPVLFPNVLTNYASFLELAQQLEDAAVRLYLGQLPTLAPEKLLYRAALAMQATEARHASHIRSLRRAAGATVKNWPSTADAALPAPAMVPTDGGPATLYAGEANQEQLIPGPLRVPFVTLLVSANNAAVADTATAEAFDEPLTTAQARALLALFS